MIAGDVVELAQALIRIPSVNPHGNPGTDLCGEAKCAEFVGDFLRACGARVELREIKPGRPNVLGVFPSDRPNKPRLIFAPHLDTVSVAGMTIDPFAPEIRDGKIFGRGASDTKGSVAAMLWALRKSRAQIAGLSHEIWFVGLMGEEAGQEGAHAFVSEFKDGKSFAIIGEPTEMQIVNTHKGSLWLTLTARGKAAHAAMPELGDNAIYKMTAAINCIRTVITPMLARLNDPILGSPTISIGTISGGTKTNIVADLCQATVDVRTLPAQDTQPIFDALKKACPEVEIAVRRAHSLFTDPTHPLIESLEKTGAKCAGAPWYCDAAIFSKAGIPAVALGPGSIAQAHTDDEWIAIDALENGVNFYRSFVARLQDHEHAQQRD